MSLFHFPPWTNKIKYLLGAGLAGGAFYAFLIVNFGFSPKTTDVGYQPEQPVPFSHALHSGQLAIDCRYCHTTVENAKHSAVPATETCMNCHSKLHTQSEKLAPVRASWESGNPVEWVRIHDLPDYVYFNHAAHVQRGIGCVSCHGRIDHMEVVVQHETLSLGWCIECHREPEKHLRPVEFITAMDWKPSDPTIGLKLKEMNNINPSQDCSTCHR